MPNISNFLQEGQYLNYTPAAATYAGNVVNLGNMAGFTPSDIAAAALGQAMISGVIRVPATATLGNVGDNVWWDANGTQAITGGTTDGACTTNAVAGDFWLGTLTAALAIADGWAEVAINKVNPNL
ncbi:MAG TPA: capsid cement protein, partial [Phycisphaerae bacterium]|nr:capsid cement protein [Phycisphaerae bacterium]